MQNTDVNQTVSDRVLAARFRAIAALVAFAIGLGVARSDCGVPSWVLFLSCGVIAGISGFWRWSVSRVMLWAALGTFACGVGQLRWHEPSGDSLASRVESRSEIGATGSTLLTVRALVVTTPKPVNRESKGYGSEESWSFRLRVSSVRVVDAESGERWEPASGSVWARVSGWSDVQPGAWIECTGLFSAVGASMNPGQPEMHVWARERGMAGFLSMSNASLMLPVDARGVVEEAASWLWSKKEALVQRSRAVVTRVCGGDETSKTRALVGALVLGEYSGQHEDLREDFSRVGLAHILSISGFHIVVFSMVAGVGLRLCGAGGRLEALIVGLTLVGMLVVVVPSAPVVRAVLMVIVLRGVEWTGRRYDTVTILVWIAILTLLWRPSDVWSLGYQLSFGLTALLLWSAKHFHESLFMPGLKGQVVSPTNLWDWARDSIYAAFSTSLLCGVISIPVVMFRVGLVSPFAIVATLVLSPLIVVLLVVTYVSVLPALLLPSLADWAAVIVKPLAKMSIASVQGFRGIPFSSISTPPVSAAWAACATMALLAMMLWTQVPRWRRVAAVSVVMIWLGMNWMSGQQISRDAVVRIDAFSVGSGTCFLVRSKDRAILWDCGSLGSRVDAREVLQAFRSVGVWRVPMAIVTHPDIDHFGLLHGVAGDLGVDQVVTCERFIEQISVESDAPAGKSVRLLGELGIAISTVKAGDQIRFGECTLTFISPESGADYRSDNDHSLVAIVEHEAHEVPAALLCGDVQAAAIEEIRDSWPSLRPLVMEVPHHGSATPEAVEWVRALDPRVVIQSSNLDRAREQRWASLRDTRTWLATAIDGACWVEVLRDGSTRWGTHVSSR